MIQCTRPVTVNHFTLKWDNQYVDIDVGFKWEKIIIHTVIIVVITV